MTGFLLAGVGNVDLRRKTNFLVVNESTLLANNPPHPPVQTANFVSWLPCLHVRGAISVVDTRSTAPRRPLEPVSKPPCWTYS